MTSTEKTILLFYKAKIIASETIFLDCSIFSLLLGHPKPKKMLIFRFVGIFEYIILLVLILFLDMCQNS